ncbi:MAG: SufE family protein [Opitutae bacterium]|nr:SufE family protein [Opitutae bacterium]
MTLAEKQQQTVDDLLLIDDPQERLAFIVDRARARPPLGEAERTEANRVTGCISQAWVAGERRDGRCHFRTDADSPLVRGLLVLLGDFYSDATPADIVATEPEQLIEQLGLPRMLSPTRLNGLRSVGAKIRAFAAAQAASGPG